MTDWRPTATRATLQHRADALGAVRSFMAERDILEVEVPILQSGANLDHGVVPARVPCSDGDRWLTTSPEHPLKRLVAAGYGDVWSLSPAVRDGEAGRWHNPEFRMLEWYRLGLDHLALASETIALLDRLTGLGRDQRVMSWEQVWFEYAGVAPEQADALLDTGTRAAIPDPAERQDLAFSLHVVPKLGHGNWCVLTPYPANQAAQARLIETADGPRAARFEIFRDGVELANGYWELTGANELIERLHAEAASRDDQPDQDESFHAAMQAGLPDCAGVAVGFDRVLMLALGLDRVGDTMAFDWPRA